MYEMEDPFVVEPKTSYLTGTLGALLFGFLAAIPWAIVNMLGWYASILGLLIAVAVKFGYVLCKGKIGKPTGFILILIILLSVFVGQVLGDVFYIARDILTGVEDMEGYVLSDLPDIMLYLFKESPEYIQEFTQNILMGLLFAGMGAFAVLRDIFKVCFAKSEFQPIMPNPQASYGATEDDEKINSEEIK